MKKNRRKAKRLSFPKLDRKGIPLQELISVQRQFSASGTLAKNLGDGFLYKTNPIFTNIRREVLRCGYRFSLQEHSHYFSFPLLCLDQVLDRKEIPYRDNFYWLEEMNRAAPEVFTLSELKRSELQFNYVFHESAHCIAHSHLFADQRMAAIPKNKESLLKILIGESFANTTEALSALCIEGEIGNYFLDANCHFRSSERDVKLLAREAKLLGLSAVAHILFGAFLYSNYLFERLDSKEWRKLAIFAGVRERSAILRVGKLGLSLSTQFRTTTTQLHLLKIGFGDGLDAMVEADPLDMLLRPKNRKIRKQVSALLDLLVSDLDSSAL